MNTETAEMMLNSGEPEELHASPGGLRRLASLRQTVRNTLTSSGFWIAALTALWPAPVLALLLALFVIWPAPAPRPSLDIYPPVVTMSPAASRQFTSKIWHDTDQSVVWSASDGVITPDGMFTVPKDAAGRILITAVRKSDPAQTASALVLIGDDMALTPSVTEIAPSQSADFLPAVSSSSAPDLEWFAAPAGIVAIKNGRATAVAGRRRPERVVITARDRNDPRRQAAAVLMVSPDPPAAGGVADEGSRDRDVMALVLIMGALGAFLGASRSFANFVGNRTFRASWGVFYLFRPVFGAGLALLVFFGSRIGGNPLAATTSNTYGISFVSGVVGLFADTALGKLKDVISTVFPTAESRMDRMHPGSPDLSPK